MKRANYKNDATTMVNRRKRDTTSRRVIINKCLRCILTSMIVVFDDYSIYINNKSDNIDMTRKVTYLKYRQSDSVVVQALATPTTTISPQRKQQQRISTTHQLASFVSETSSNSIVRHHPRTNLYRHHECIQRLKRQRPLNPVQETDNLPNRYTLFCNDPIALTSTALNLHKGRQDNGDGITTKTRYKQRSNADNSNNNNNSNDNNIDLVAIVLNSYVFSIQRTRRRILNENNENPSIQTQAVSSRDKPIIVFNQGGVYVSKDDFLRPSRSLARYLNSNRLSAILHNSHRNGYSNVDKEHQKLQLIYDYIHRAVIQAIRSAALANDYKLILLLVQSMQSFWFDSLSTTTSHSTIHSKFDNRTSLQPRIIGEAISGLTKTSVNINKIRSFWKLYFPDKAALQQDRHFGQPTSVEINAMIRSLIQFGKIRAALNIYHDMVEICDSYTVSLLLNSLRDSIMSTSSTLVGTNSTSTEREPQQLSATISILPQIQNDDVLTIAPASSWLSQYCWQWNEAIQLLDSAIEYSQLNNPIISSLLRLNKQTTIRDGIQHHNGPLYTIQIIALLQQLKISPDERTFTLLLTNLGKYWQLALRLIRSANEQQQKIQQLPNSAYNTPHLSSTWTLPAPNNHIYSAGMAICAQNKQTDACIKLLQEVIQVHDSNPDFYINNNLYPNTWMYNSILQSLVVYPTVVTVSNTMGMLRSRAWKNDYAGKKSKKIKMSKIASKQRLDLVINLLAQMECSDSASQQPDTVTYNTALSAVASISQTLTDDADWSNLSSKAFYEYITTTTESDDPVRFWPYKQRLVHTILDKMEQQLIHRDIGTYRHAFQVLNGSNQQAIFRLLDRCIYDVVTTAESRTNRPTDDNIKRQKSKNGKRVNNDINDATVISELYHASIGSLSVIGDIDGINFILDKMSTSGVPMQHDSLIKNIIVAFGKCDKTDAIPTFLLALTGDSKALMFVVDQHNLNLQSISELKSKPTMDQCSAAIQQSLQCQDFKSAHRILVLMKHLNMQPSNRIREDIALSYSSLALSDIGHFGYTSLPWRQKKVRALKITGNLLSERKIDPAIVETAQARVLNSYRMTKELLASSGDNLPIRTVAYVSNACGAVGLFHEARTLLLSIHKRLIHGTDNTVNKFSPDMYRDSLQSLKLLHPKLLRYCANEGNVTNALRLCEDIQSFSKQMKKKKKSKMNDKMIQLLSASSMHLTERDNSDSESDRQNVEIVEDEAGMMVEEWKSVLIAASKSGHWRVCLTTLHFLQPYIEATHPSLAHTDAECEELSIRYNRLEVCLITAVRCMQIRSQYGWAVRAIDDWIKWSGRRPPREAVLAAIRSLASRGRGDEVNAMLVQCTGMPRPKVRGNDPAYAPMLFIGAITALYHDGLYDAADDAYVTAINQDALQLNIQRGTSSSGELQIVVDLHGMNVAVARSALRIALQQEFVTYQPAKDDKIQNKNATMIIITGRGLNSALRMRPVIRPEVQRMFQEEFYPPLNTISVPGNMGALMLSSDDITAWLEHQKKERGMRMLTVANMLATYSDRLKSALAQATLTTKASNSTRRIQK
jgi:Smr domain